MSALLSKLFKRVRRTMVFSHIFFLLRYLRMQKRKRLKTATFVVMIALQVCAAEDTNTTGPSASALPSKISMDCCALLQTISQYTAKPSADSVDVLECQKNNLCTKMPVITNFVTQTQLTLGNANSVTIENTSVTVLESVLQKVAAQVLFLAFLGRAVDKEIKFDGNSLTMIDSECSKDKTIYSTIVVASIALLIFFVASQIVEKEKHASTAGVVTTKVATVDSTIGNPLMLRMRMH